MLGEGLNVGGEMLGVFGVRGLIPQTLKLLFLKGKTGMFGVFGVFGGGGELYREI